MMEIQLLLEWDGMSGDVIFVFPRRKKKIKRKRGKSEREVAENPTLLCLNRPAELRGH